MDKQQGKRARIRKRTQNKNTYRFIENNTKKSNWKTPGHDGINDRLALKMNRCLQEADVPEWMTKGKTTLVQKDHLKGTAPNN